MDSFDIGVAEGMVKVAVSADLAGRAYAQRAASLQGMGRQAFGNWADWVPGAERYVARRRPGMSPYRVPPHVAKNPEGYAQGMKKGFEAVRAGAKRKPSAAFKRVMERVKDIG